MANKRILGDFMENDFMNMQRIFSKNAIYQKFEVLLSNRNKRYKYNEFIVEGVRNINEAVRNDWQINSFIYPHDKKLSGWAVDLLCNVKTEVNYELTENLMSELSGKENTSELMAVVKMKSNSENDKKLSVNPVIALFDRPSNKGNLGTMLRSCDAFGVEKLIITGHSADIYDPGVIGASMGSFFKVPFIRLADNPGILGYIAGLKQKYPLLKIIGTVSQNGTAVYDIDMTVPVLFLIGNETEGLSRLYLEIGDIYATIPMSGQSSASSFNVSCAATVTIPSPSRQNYATTGSSSYAPAPPLQLRLLRLSRFPAPLPLKSR
jgi:TrmH family RNA methyltransferase